MFDLSFYKGKKVFVTGHTGFKGSWLCRVLIKAGAEVTGYALMPPKDEPNLYDLCIKDSSEKLHSVIGDIRDLKTLEAAFAGAQPEIVFHLAAQPIVRESYRNPVYTYETNVMGTVNILECIRKNDSVISFLNVTTDKVYKNNEQHEGYTEEDKLDGYDPYSNSKSCSELVTHSYKQSFFSDNDSAGIVRPPAISTARAGNVIGGGDFSKDRIIPDCVRSAMKKEPVIIRNVNSVRPFQHVLEPVFVYLMIAERQAAYRKYEGCYNVGPDNADCVTAGELADMFCKSWGDGLTWIDKSDNGPHEAGLLRLDCTKCKNTFGWQPRWNVRQAVEKTVEWSKLYVAGGDISGCMDRQIGEIFNV